MNLRDLIAAVAASGEQAMEATRRAYAANVEALHQSDAPRIPGSPPLATVVLLDTLGPKRLRLRTHVELGESDGCGDRLTGGAVESLVEPHTSQRFNFGYRMGQAGSSRRRLPDTRQTKSNSG